MFFKTIPQKKKKVIRISGFPSGNSYREEMGRGARKASTPIGTLVH
jgi:hypothetical protein